MEGDPSVLNWTTLRLRRVRDIQCCNRSGYPPAFSLVADCQSHALVLQCTRHEGIRVQEIQRFLKFAFRVSLKLFATHREWLE